MKASSRVLIGVVAIIAAVFFFYFLIGNHTIGLFDAQGPTAAAERNLIILMVALMLIVAIPMLFLLYRFAWKYRDGNKNVERDTTDRPHAVWRELLLWCIPGSVVIVLAVLTWNSAHALDPFKPIDSSVPPITIQVVALQWKWLFIYPQQNIATVNFVEFPAGTPVHFELTADAPMSSFWIPQLGTQIYAMAAMETQLNTIASTTGSFVGKDTEINGAGYAGMQFIANSVTQADFNNWVQGVKNTGQPLTDDDYNALAAPSQNNLPAYYSSVDTQLFDSIIMKYMMPPSSMQSMPGMSM